MGRNVDSTGRVPWIRTLLPVVRPYRLHLAGAGLTLALDAVLTALRPWPLKVVIDRVISEGNCRVPLFSDWINDPSHDVMTILAAACIASIVIAMGTGTSTYLSTIFLGTVSQGLLFSLRTRLFTHLQRLSLRFHNESRIGDLMARLTSDISSIRMLVARGLMNFLSSALLTLSMLVMMLWLNWKFALIACSVSPLLFWSVWWHTRRIKDESRFARASDGELAALAQESLSMIQTVKGFGRESAQQGRFDAQGRQSLDHYTSRLRHQARMAPIVDVLAATGLVLVMWFGATGVLEGELTTGDMVVFFTYVTNFYSPMRAMSRQASIFTKGAVGAERVASVLNREPEIRDRPDAIPAPQLAGDIAFESVCFSYNDGRPVLQDFSVQIRPGERVAILGATGAGKSTIAALLLRLHKPQTGRILLDGNDMTNFTTTSVRQQIGLVLQEPMLFRATIRDNILFGHSDPDEGDLVEACRIAGVDEFIDRTRDGLNTMVAEGGKSLSGGQRQRIAIARAVFRQAPILLLDEPTSSLDVNSEAETIRSLSRAASGRTVILITHRPGTLRLVDRVVVLESGHIVDECAPEHAMARYAEQLFSGERPPL